MSTNTDHTWPPPRLPGHRLWTRLVFCLSITVSALPADGADTGEAEVPGYTAYLDPVGRGAHIDPARGVTGWTGQDVSIQFYVQLQTPGQLTLALKMSLPDSDDTAISVSLAKKTFTVKVPKTARNEFAQVPVGSVDIKQAGYVLITLKGLRRKGRSFGDIRSLVLSGTATKGMHFNTKPRRNAASVHLWYPTPKGHNVEWFYNEITVPRGADPIHSYYMACGFSRGYYGIQVNSPTERRVIFSIWDSGNEGVDRSKVKEEDRVKLLAKGAGVVAHGFGNEGTGGHSHWVHSWKAGTTYRFLVHARPEKTATIYTAYFHLAEPNRWKVIASFRAPKDGKHFRGLYSFVENFGGATGHIYRKAHFGRQWFRNNEGQWHELKGSRFTHDPTGRKERRDYGGGPEAAGFYLFNGGFRTATAKYGDRFTRTISTRPPQVSVPLKPSDLVK